MARSADPLDNDPPTERTKPLKEALDAIDNDSTQSSLATPVPANKDKMRLTRKDRKK